MVECTVTDEIVADLRQQCHGKVIYVFHNEQCSKEANFAIT